MSNKRKDYISWDEYFIKHYKPLTLWAAFFSSFVGIVIREILGGCEIELLGLNHSIL